MNGPQAVRHPKPPPTGPTPPAPSTAPPAPPNHRQPNGTTHNSVASSTTPGTTPAAATNTNTGAVGNQKVNKKKQTDPQVDASQIYETLKNKIAALEEDAVHEEEEERRFGMSSSLFFFPLYILATQLYLT